MKKFCEVCFILLIFLLLVPHPGKGSSNPNVTIQVIPQHFGAKADGLTDDTEAIHKTINSLPTGGKVFFPAGTYIVNSISVGSNITLEGVGPQSVLKCTRLTGSNYYGIVKNRDQTTGNTNITIRNLKFWRTVEIFVEDSGGRFDEHIYMKKVSHLKIEGCYFLGTVTRSAFEGHSGKGINLHGCQYIDISDNTFENIPDNSCGNHYDGGMTEGYARYSGNVFIYTPTSTGTTHAHSFIIPNQHYVVIEGNIAYSDPAKTAGVLLVESGPIYNRGSWEAHKGVNVKNNIGYNAGIGLRAHNGATVTGNQVYKSTICCMADQRIQSSDILFYGNIAHEGSVGGGGDHISIIGNTMSDYANHGLYIDTSSDLTIIGNHIRNSGKGGIVLAVIAKGLDISHNVIENVGLRGGSGGDVSGIAIDLADNAIIKNNQIYDLQPSPTMKYGIYLSRSMNLTLESNVVRNKNINATGISIALTNLAPTTFAKRGGNSFNYTPQEPIHLFANSVPTTGTWHKGTIIDHFDAAPGEPSGWFCTSAGTFSAAADSTGRTDGSTNVITGMSDTSGFHVGEYVTVSGGLATTGPYIILEKTATTITINANSNSVQSNITVSTPDPVFKAMASIAQ